MEELKLIDLVNVVNVDSKLINISYIEPQTIFAQNGMGTISFQQKITQIKLTKQYINDDIIIKDAIDILLEKQKEFDDIIYFYNIYKNINYNNDNVFKHKILQLSNMIHRNSLIGAGDTLIIPNWLRYIEFPGIFKNVFYTDALDYNIIILKKGDQQTTNFSLFKNNYNEYVISFIGDYENMYQVLNLRSKNRIRAEKLKRIL